MISVEKIKRRPLLYGGLAMALIQLGVASPDINAQMEAREQMQTQRQSERREQAQMILDGRAREERAAIALQRYEAGCLRVVNRDNNNAPIALKQGDTVYDYYNDVPLAAGSVVCDSFGVTGVVSDDFTVQDVAILLDLSLIPGAVNQVDGSF